MKAKQVAITMGLEAQYQKAVNEIGETHTCNQGCGEGWCGRNEDAHQQELLEFIQAENIRVNQVPRNNT
jgi:hypothetical protein